jgi:hypothetical protein
MFFENVRKGTAGATKSTAGVGWHNDAVMHLPEATIDTGLKALYT